MKYNRQADTKDLTSSSKVLRVLGPNLTDASYLQGLTLEKEIRKQCSGKKSIIKQRLKEIMDLHLQELRIQEHKLEMR
jgi:hypothetical protein